MTQPGWPSAGGPIPDLAYRADTVGEMQSITEQTAKDQINQPLIDAFDSIFPDWLSLWNGFTSLQDFLHNITTALGVDAISSEVGDLLDGLAAWAAKFPIIGDLVEILTGKEDGDLNDLGTWILQLRALLSGEAVANPLPGLEGLGITSLFRMVQQIGDILGGLVVTPINSIVAGVKDWFAGLLGWQSTTTSKHQSLTNMVWTGATSAPIENDRTSQEVRDAVASLKARSEALKAENEMRYQSAVPMWQGLVPGGDVTVDLDRVNIGTSTRTVAVYGSTGVTTNFGGPHDHSAGSLKADVPVDAGAITSAGLTSGTDLYLISAFRARSNAERNYITFIASASGSTMTGAVHAGLLSYDYESDAWRCVAKSDDVMSQIPVNGQAAWVDAALTEGYTPEIGELLAVIWRVSGTVTGTHYVRIAASTTPRAIPPYNAVPYGTAALGSASNQGAGFQLGDQISLPQANWRNGCTPYAQIAPDLGQYVNPIPQYWFDDFNSDSTGNYFRSFNARISGGKFAHDGNADTEQFIIRAAQMSTNYIRIEADLTEAESVPVRMRLGTSNSGAGGVDLKITHNTLTLSTVSYQDWSALTSRATASHSQIASARWSIHFDTSNNTYYVQRNNVTMLQWTDNTNLAHRGKGFRSGGLSVSRFFFNDSGAWDNLLIYDIE